MTTQYNYDRRYSLAITKPTELFGEQAQAVLNQVATTPFLSTYQAVDDYNAISNLTVTIEDLQIEVDIDGSNQTSGSDRRKAKITVYNLSETTRSIICNKNNNVILKAGYASYEDELPVIFCGQVKSFTTKKQGEDVLTILDCEDGWVPTTSTRVSIRVPAGKNYRDVFTTLAGEWNKAGVATGKIVTDYQLLLSDPSADLTPDLTGVSRTLPPQDIELIKGWSFSGKLRQAMDELCEQFNHTWQIVNNRLYVHPKYYGEMIGVVTLDDTQIISAEDIQEGSQNGSTSSEPKGIRVECLLDGRIDEAKRITLASGSKAGTYPIRTVSHKLSYEGSVWNTIIECGGA